MASSTRRGDRRRDEDPNDPPDDGFNDDQREEITRLVNAAVGSHMQRRMPAMLDQALRGPLGEIRTLIEGSGGGRGRQRDPEPDDADPDDPQTERQPARRGRARDAAPARERDDRDRDERPARGADPEVVAMKKQLAKLEAERKAERESARSATRDASLRELLTSAGVDKNRIRGAIAVLRESTKFDDKTSEWAFIRKSDGIDEELDLDTGVREWAATDEGKSYLAPPTAGGPGGGPRAPQLRSGSGTRPGGSPARGGAAPVADPKQAKVQAKQQAMQTLTSAIGELAGGNVPLG